MLLSLSRHLELKLQFWLCEPLQIMEIALLLVKSCFANDVIFQIPPRMLELQLDIMALHA
jgi:hypothetical protein